MEMPRFVVLLLAALGAIGLTVAAVDRFRFHFGYEWELLAASVIVCGAAGILAQRKARRASVEAISKLTQEVEWQREQLQQARSRSSALQSESALALRDSEALYHSLVDHLPLSVLRKDKEGKYTFVNRRYLEFSGKRLHDILGTTDFDNFPQELAARYRQGDERVLTTGALFEDVESYQKLDGEKRYIQVLKTPIRDAQQQINGTQVMFWDVTDRRRAEEALEHSTHEVEQRNAALRESEQSLQRQTGILTSILDSIADGVIVADPEGRFLVWNPAAARIVGLGPIDEPSTRWTEAYGLFKTDRTTPYPANELPLRRAIRGETVADIELFVRNESRPEGAMLSVNGTPLLDAAGRIQGGVVVFRDVTEQNAAADALRHSEERARQIIETAFDPYISIDNAGKVIYWNSQAEKTFGFSRSEALGAVLADLIIPHQHRQAHIQGISMYLETGEGPVFNSRIEISALHRDGHEFPVELTIWPVRTETDVSFHAFVHDITRRRKNEEEIRSKNQDLETLLYVTSHDLREPLRAIENFSRIVKERYADKLDAKGQDFLDRVVRGAQRLDRLIEDVLTLSRVQRTAQPVEDVSAGEIVADVLHHLEPRIRETQAVVSVADELPHIRADRRWATQAVQNLVSNALKYSAEGRAPVVEIGTFEGPEGTGLIVGDRGMGVPPDCAERIFQLFQRAVSRNIEGTGAGLAIVKRVAERHGGKAWVRPREGGGSEFIITFGSSNSA
ncbi:MAG TPA: PAS domain S-box protein [Planctomycetaceae bacterium]|jgi:PAS domain S-box-containing protein